MSTDPFARIKELQDELEDNKKRLNAAESRNRRLQGFESEVQELRKSLKASDKALREAREAREEAKREQARAEAGVSDVRVELENARAQIGSLTNDLEHARKFAGESGDKAREADAARERVQVSLDSLERRVQDAIQVLQG